MNSILRAIIFIPYIIIQYSIRILLPITGILVHLWTVIIAYSEKGIIGSIITLFVPVLSQFYWIYYMWGENSLYVWIVIIHLILGFIATFSDRPN